MSAPAKRPLCPNGGTPVEDADMPLSDLDKSYRPDAAFSPLTIEKTPEQTLPASVQDGDQKTRSQ